MADLLHIRNVRPLQDMRLVDQAVAIFSEPETGRTAAEIRAEHDAAVASMDGRMLAALRRAWEAGRRSANHTGDDDHHLNAVCRNEARWQHTDVVA